MKTRAVWMTVTGLMALALVSTASPPKVWYETVGVLPNAEIAESVARPILEGLYGKPSTGERKLEARLRQQIWIVEEVFPDNTLGEPMEIWLRKDNGQVVWVKDLRNRFRDRYPQKSGGSGARVEESR